MKIGFLGAGNLGTAIIKGLINSHKVKEQDIKIVIASKKSYQYWQQKGFAVSIDWDSLQECDVIVVALLPSVISANTKKLQEVFAHKTIISVASGITLKQLRIIFEHSQITRAMPNTSSEFNKSMTMITSDGDNGANDFAEMIFSLCGATIFLLEKHIHLFIGICGSASAYFYHWLVPFMNQALQYNLSESEARKIIAQLLIGVATNISHSEKSLPAMQEDVTSPGGTTYEAIKVFETEDIQETISQAISACITKSKTLEKS